MDWIALGIVLYIGPMAGAIYILGSKLLHERRERRRYHQQLPAGQYDAVSGEVPARKQP